MGDANSEKPYDPLETWREMRDASMEAWAKFMTDAVRTDAYAQSSGAMLDAYLTASAPFHEAMQKAVAQTLEQLNLPSRDDVANLSERLTNIEMRLDDMEAKLDRVLARKAGSETAPRPSSKTSGKGGK